METSINKNIVKFYVQLINILKINSRCKSAIFLSFLKLKNNGKIILILRNEMRSIEEGYYENNIRFILIDLRIS